MATPTPSQPSNPSSASKKAGQAHVSTPSHLSNNSPFARGVPSPAATRKEHAGKTPVNHPTTGSTASKATPMMHSLSQQGHTQGSSPGTNLLGSFGTPVGLGMGIDGGNFASTPGMGGAPMMPTMSELGLKRNEDEERQARMRKVLKSIGRPKGRVSEEGIARISRRVGFQNDIDAETLSEADRQRKVGNREIVIAGKKIIISVELKQHVPQRLQVEFATQNQALMEIHAPAAATVLLADLKSDPATPLRATLDNFALNLERLASVDRLSGEINCFEAIHGIYANLLKLWEEERKQADIIEVMCKRSGRPKLHADGRIGFSIDYWQHKRMVPPPPKMEDGSEPTHSRTFKLHVEVEPSPATLYPPLRISEVWLPDPLELPSPTSGEGLPWQDPPPTIVQAGGDGTAMSMETGQNLPNLRFIAKLDPPIVVEYTTAVNLLASFDVPAPQLAVFPPHYHVMVTNPSAPYTMSQPPPPTLITSNTVVVMQDGQEVDVQNHTRFGAKPQEFGWRIDELPFSHPRQLIQALPTLRQWASLGALISDAFSSRDPTKNNMQEDLPSEIRMKVDMTALPEPPTPPLTPHALEVMPVYMDIACLPTPTLSTTFPGEKDGQPKTQTVAIQIQPNGQISNVVGVQDLTQDSPTHVDEAAAQALDRCNDLGVWVQWLRNRTKTHNKEH